MEKSNWHYVTKSKENGLFEVIDRRFPFKIFGDNGEMEYRSGLVASFKNKSEANELVSRLALRNAWGQ